jgi:16S rRNA (guanine527-N7)-methyltransferase
MKNQINELIKKIFTSNENFENLDLKIEKIIKFIDFLKLENENKNLVSRKTTDEEILNKHILSSLLFVKHIFKAIDFSKIKNNNSVEKIVDIGSGSGFPSIICAIFYPEINFSVVDSVQKKIDFLYDSAKILDLKNVECFWGRIEDFGDADGFKGTFDICTARALGTIELTTEYSMPLLKKNGIFLTIKSLSQEIEFEKAFKFIENIGHSYSVYKEIFGESFMLHITKIKEIEKNQNLKKNKSKK